MKKIIYYLMITLGLIFSSNSFAEDANKEAQYDLKFVNTIIDHRNQGIEIFKLAVLNANSRKISFQAKYLIERDEKAIDILQLLRDQLQANVQGLNEINLLSKDTINMDKLRSKKGQDFDKRFLKDAINFSKDTIKICENALDKSQNPDIKNQARAIINEENQRIEQFKTISEEI